MTAEEKLKELEQQEWNSWANLIDNPHATTKLTTIQALEIIDLCQRIRERLTPGLPIPHHSSRHQSDAGSLWCDGARRNVGGPTGWSRKVCPECGRSVGVQSGQIVNHHRAS